MGSWESAVVVCTHLQALLNMKIILLLALTGSAFAARQLRGNTPRGSRSLTNTFPFNQKAGEEEHHGDHGEHPGAHGKRCIDKVEMVEETEYDDVVQCDHSYDRRC